MRVTKETVWPACQNCRWWHGDANTPKYQRMRCMRFPPTQQHLPETTFDDAGSATMWALTLKDDECGEFTDGVS